MFWPFNKSKENPKEVNKNIDINKSEKQLLSEIKKENEILSKDLNPKVKDIISNLITLSSIASSLESKTLPEMDKRLIKRVNEARELFCQRLISLAEKLQTNDFELNSFEDFLEANEKLSSIIKNISEIGVQQGQYIAIAFKKDIDNFSYNMKELVNRYKSFDNQLKAYSSKFNDLNKKLAIISEIRKNLENLKIEYDNLNDLKERIKQNEEEINNLSKQLDSLKNNPSYLDGLKKENELLSNKNNLKLRLNNLFLPIKKPLARYIHDFNFSISKEDKLLLEKYISEPIEGLTLDDKQSLIKILDKLKYKLETNQIYLEEKLKAKTLDAILNITKNFNYFSNQLKDFQEQENNLKEFENIKINISHLQKLIASKKEEQLNLDKKVKETEINIDDKEKIIEELNKIKIS